MQPALGLAAPPPLVPDVPTSRQPDAPSRARSRAPYKTCRSDPGRVRREFRTEARPGWTEPGLGASPGAPAGKPPPKQTNGWLFRTSSPAAYREARKRVQNRPAPMPTSVKQRRLTDVGNDVRSF